MAHYGGAAVQDRIEGRDPRTGRDPGDILQEAIDLWCYFLKLESDPLAYRWGDLDQRPVRSSSRPDADTAGETTAREA